MLRLVFLLLLSTLASADLHFKSNGTFRIVQFTDTHFGSKNATEDDITYSIMTTVLDHEQPDLVILSGDMVTGNLDPKKSDEWYRSKWKHLTKALIEHNVQWAFTFGNHDALGFLDRDQVAELDMSYPLSLTEKGPESIFGVTNYRLGILGTDGSEKAAIWMLDSGINECMGVKAMDGSGSGWGCVETSQIEYFMSKVQGDQVPSLAVFHIPIYEFMWSWDYNETRGDKQDQVRCPTVNTGLYSAFLQAGNVRSVHCGHDHLNDYWSEWNGIRLMYGRKTGKWGFGPPHLRGARVIELTEDPFSIHTWIRQEDASVIDEMAQPLHKPVGEKGQVFCNNH